MAGVVRGKIEQVLSEIESGSRQIGITGFKNVFDFLEAHPGTTRIALGYGIGGTGTDYPAGANPFGALPFGVWRWDANVNRDFAWYLFVAGGNDGSRTTTITEFRPAGTTGGGSDGIVSVSAAVGIGGDGNPWGGTTNNDGTDTLPSPGSDLWVVPAAGTNVKVIPASNSLRGSGGGEAKNETLRVMDFFSASTPRANVVADDDSIFFFCDEGDSGAYNMNVLIGWIDQPDPAVDDHPNPLFGFWTGGGTNADRFTAQDYDCGVFHYRDDEEDWPAVEVTLPYPEWLEEDAMHPHDQVAHYATRDIEVVAVTAGHKGPMGLHSLIKHVHQLPARDTDTGLDTIVVGSLAAGNTQFLAPWDGVTTPGSGTVQEGIDF